MTNHCEGNFSSLIRAEFDKVLKKGPHINKKEIYESNNLSNSSFSCSEVQLNPERKWVPNKIWDEDELKSLVEVSYAVETFTCPEFVLSEPKEVPEIKKNSENANIERRQIVNTSKTNVDIKMTCRKFNIDANISRIIDVQKEIDNLTEDRLEEVAKEFYDLSYFSSEQNVKKLIFEMICTIKMDKSKTKVLVGLIKLMIKMSKDVFIGVRDDVESEVESIVIKTLLTQFFDDDQNFISNVPKLYLLKQCVDAAVVSVSQTMNLIMENIKNYPVNTNYHNLVFCFFAQIIEANDKAVADEIFNRIESTCWYSSTKLRGTLSDFYNLKKKHWREMNYLASNGCLNGSIEQIIDSDNLEALKREFQKGTACNQCLKTVFSPNIWRTKEMTMIEWAALCGSLSIFKYLMVNEGDLTKLAPFAIAGGNKEICELCKGGENTKAVLKAAAVFRRYDKFDEILKNATKEDIDELLCQCAKSNNLRGCVACVNKHADINYHVKRDNGMSPFLYAARYGHIDIISYLMSCTCVTVNIVDDEGNSAVHYAARNNMYHAVSVLLSFLEVDGNIENNLGRTALHEASINGSLEAVKILCTMKGVNPNIKDNNGMTPIMCANKFGQTKVSEYLSARGVESDLTQNRIRFADKMFSSSDIFNTNDIATDELSTDMSIDSILINEINSPMIS